VAVGIVRNSNTPNDLTDVEIWTDRKTMATNMATNMQSSLVDPVGEIFKTKKNEGHYIDLTKGHVKKSSEAEKGG